MNAFVALSPRSPRRYTTSDSFSHDDPSGGIFQTLRTPRTAAKMHLAPVYAGYLFIYYRNLQGPRQTLTHTARDEASNLKREILPQNGSTAVGLLFEWFFGKFVTCPVCREAVGWDS